LVLLQFDGDKWVDCSAQTNSLTGLFLYLQLCIRDTVFGKLLVSE